MKRSEIYAKAKEQNKTDITRFMRDMRKAGLKADMRYYEGRWFYKGPGVTVGSIEDVLQATKVNCAWDNMGKDYIVHPRQSL